METLLLLLLLSCSIPSASSTTTPILLGNETDVLSLLAFKSQITHDSSGVLNSWNGTNHFCNWGGVSCRSRKHPGRVTAVELSSLGLAGLIPPSIVNLTFLAVLNLSSNSFYGTIPPEIGIMRRLQLLDLSFNSLRGTIPVNLTYCSHLKILDLKSNTLSGKIPSELGSLPKLSFLSISNNSLTGTIPTSIGNLSHLHQFAASINQLVGNIPHEIGSLWSLQFFQVSGNKLSGMVPSSLFNLSSLYYFGLADNQLEGNLPSTMGITLPNLQTLLLGGNQFEGPIPSSLPNASSLSFIDMSINNLNGKVPPNLGKLGSLSQLNLEFNQLEANDTNSWEFITSLANCSQLKMLSLDHNKLSGELPNSIGNLSTHLQELRLNVNQISGRIPPGIENLVNLTILALGPNLITGVVPEGIGKLKKLQLLTLYRSRLAGNIPSSLGNLTKLTYLYLTGNNLDGPIPASLGNLQQVEELGLGSNDFSGAIPIEFFGMSSLEACGLSYNSFVGNIPLQVSSMKYLRELYIAGNMLTGEIPRTLGDCQLLDSLDFSHNFFRGEIPSSFSNLEGLQLLDLSQNNLSGPIPDFLGKLSLSYLNLSFNNFEGEVPAKGIFQNATATSLLGNDKLCGGIPEFHLLSCPSKYTERRGISLLLKIVIATASSLLLLASLGFICWKAKSRRENSPPPQSEDRYMRVSYEELAKATDGFSDANLIGTGSYGSVYKGILDHEDTTVAVKVFNLERQGASKSFTDECDALKNIRHRNLIKILTSCSSVDPKGDDFKALVFEFMPNGNLETWLHAENNGNNRSTYLSLIQRLNIAINVADALDYLHHDCQTPVIHCDLKPSNILLDDDMVARVGDFGLARLLTEMSKPLQDSSYSIAIRGTVGYVPPEYGAGSQVSTSGDVYSYGILLLEMFTGTRPVADMFKDGNSLHKSVEMAFPDRIMEIADPLLLLQQEEGRDFMQNDKIGLDSRNGFLECIASVARVGLSCSKESPRERMNMRVVATELHAIRDAFIGVGVS